MAKNGRRVRIFSALEVANICGVVNQTAINWIKSGHLKAFTTPGGQYRIYAKDFAAFLDKRGMGASGEVLQTIMENVKVNWDTFLIAADPLINDMAKAGIEKIFPEYSVIQAFDWFETGKKISEEKPGFVLLDAELPGGDISRFVSTIKDDIKLGKPYVLLLTDGSSDNVAVDAVLTKPLELSELEEVIKSLKKPLDSTATA